MSADRSVLFRQVRVRGALTEVLVLEGRIHLVGAGVGPERGTEVEVVHGEGGELLPGLHDHHVHLAATAAAMASVEVGPPRVTTVEQFARALGDAALGPGNEWIRAVGYHESVAGPLDRELLDRLVPDRPVRVQDRSGVRWTLNSTGLEAVRAADARHPGIARDHRGRPTGPIDRGDDWLRDAIGSSFPDLTHLGRRLAALGVTGVTDCTPYTDDSGPAALAAAVASGALPQSVHVTGGIELVDRTAPAPLHQGPVKLVLDEVDLPDLVDLSGRIVAAHEARRPVAVHAVTAATLAFALAAWDQAGVRTGDRVEHGSVISPAAGERLARLGLTVVTQPAFVAERGDEYLSEVPLDEVPDLYRCATLHALGVPMAAGSDAPYTDPDPWAAIRAATDRRTPTGVVLGADERVTPDRALGLYLGDPLDPGRRSRTVAVGHPADLVLLDRPWSGSGTPPTADAVRASFREGVRI